MPDLVPSDGLCREVLEQAPLGVALIDHVGGIAHANAALGVMLGDHEHLIGRTFADFAIAAHRDWVVEALRRALEDGITVTGLRVSVVRPDGATRLVRLATTPVHQDAAVIGAAVMLEDITEQTEHERDQNARLREREQTLVREHALFSEGPVIVFLWRAAEGWPVEYVSDNVARELGYTPEQLMSGEVSFASVVHPQDLARVADEVREHTVAGRSHFQQEYRLVRADGTVRWYFDVTNILRDGEGRAISYHGYILDITERHLAEESLQESLQELAHSNADLEQFAYVASHDLQEPLRMVASYLRLLEKRHAAALDGDAREFIGFAVDGATRMQALIDDLLAYSRIGRKDVVLEPVALDAVLDAALSDLQLQIADCGAEVVRDPLPAVEGDPHQLRQLFENLIGNALKYRRDGVVPRVQVDVEREARHWVCSVRDNGIGIESRHQDRIFIIFQRLHGRDRYPGTGIGLALCKKIVERHGGRIWLESTPGEGSRFLFTLPVRNG